MPLHGEHSRRVVQLLAHFRTDVHALAASARIGVLRSCLASVRGSCAGSAAHCGLWLKLLELSSNGDEIRLNRLAQQLQLIAAELLAAPAQLVMSEN